MNKQLFRSRTNKKIAGVCGGIAEYFNIDPTVVRLIWVLFTLTYGIGFVAYIVAVIIIPEQNTGNFGFSQGQNQETNHQEPNSDAHRGKVNFDGTRSSIILGIILILVGILLLGGHYITWLSLRQLWPVIFIVVGVLIIFGGGRNKK
jgi:phage shock protein C